MGGYLARYLQRCLRSPWAAKQSCCAQEPKCPSLRPRRCPRDPGLFHPALVFPGFFVLSRALPRTGPRTEHTGGPRPADPAAAQPGAPKPPLWPLLKAGLSAPRPGHTKRRPPGAQRRPGTRSPVTVVIKAPQRPGTRYKGPPVAPMPDPCAQTTVLQALSKGPKGRKKVDRPLWFEKPEPEVPKPQVDKPQVAKPRDTKPQVAQPRDTKPQVSKLQFERPQVDEPQVAKPQVTKLPIDKLQVNKPEVAKPESPELEVPDPPKTREPRPSALVPVISKGVVWPFAPQLGPATGINRPVPRRPPQSLPPRRPSPVGAGCVPWCRHCTGQRQRLAAADPGAGAPQSRGLGPGRPAQQPQQRTPPEPQRPLSPMVPLTAPRGPNGPIFFRYRPTVIIVSY
ncbi:Hypothetical predicted protein [Marmota monax]|uniref:Uncharacterized protein n=1 Tax=Marmota monax TaxID=9995 RepID=A0A5E4CVS5_MARMO|nr:Hypothetical predicted protein [Marmota monax]